MRLAAALVLALLAACGKKNHDQAHAKGHLGALRSALSMYYGDTEGRYPVALDALVPKYLAAVPTLELPDHPPTNFSKVEMLAPSQSLAVTDSGMWLYFSSGPLAGAVLIDCTHTEPGGRRWVDY